MEEFLCSKCRETKPVCDAVKNKRAKSGMSGICKQCNAIKSKEWRSKNKDAAKAFNERWRLKNLDKHNLYSRNWYSNNMESKNAKNAAWQKANPEKVHAIVKRYRSNHPERARAHDALNNEVRSGKITRLPCEVCGSEVVEGHHEDYSKPLAVNWLCQKHHKEIHRSKKDKS